MFYLGGTFLSSQYVDHLKFTCKLAGVPVYLQNFPVAQQALGAWSYNLPFDIPADAPTITYYVTITALNSGKLSATSLFVIDAVFSLF